MTQVQFSLNGDTVSVDAEPGTPLLWVIRDELKLTGTKYGCGVAQCGACSVLLDGQRIFSCVTPVESIAGRSVTTIEGIDKIVDAPLKQSWIEERVPQCGYCQPGMIVTAASLLSANPNPSDEEIAQHMTNICRCGTYPRILKAIKRAAAAKEHSEK